MRDTAGREALLRRYRSLLDVNPQLDRSIVSFQANRRQPFYGWFKYKEGFSSRLVAYAIDRYMTRPGVVLDPFAGVGTTLFVARSKGHEALGIELMPLGPRAVDARLAAEQMQPGALKRAVVSLEGVDWAEYYEPRFAYRHVPITSGAFGPQTERAIGGFRSYCARHVRDERLHRVLDFACLTVLESVSYTRKDGQYLRWDHRANRPRLRSSFDKGPIPDFASAIRGKLQTIAHDACGVVRAGSKGGSTDAAGVALREGSCLEALPTLEAQSVDLVVTSPPYCNRYDYTRTYALELAYCGLSAERFKILRQQLLSCTVENKAKADQILSTYRQRADTSMFHKVEAVFEAQTALHEVLDSLASLGGAGLLNNPNIPRMVRNYFFEMCFVIGELWRIVRPGGRVVMVNDNVRYAGQEVPVDLILSDVARCFGFDVETIWSLARGKGNSSQQMATHGRHELRKGVYVWVKL